MSNARRIARNIAWYLPVQVVSYALQFVFVITLMRHFGMEMFGVISLAMAFNVIFGMIADLGLRQVTAREVARDKSRVKEFMADILGMKLFLTLAAFFSLCVFTLAMGYPPQTKSVVWTMGAAIVFDSFSVVFYGLFQGYERMEFESLALLLKSSLLCGTAFLVRYSGLPVGAMAVMYVSASAVVLSVNLAVSCRRFYVPRIQAHWAAWMRVFRESLPFGFLGLCTVLYQWTGTVILSKSQGNAAVGIYNAAYSVLMVLLLVPISFDMAIFPVMSRFFVRSKEKIVGLEEHYLKYLMYIGLPIAVYVAVSARPLVIAFFGVSYAPASVPLQILMVSMLLIFAGTPFSCVLNSINRQAQLARIIAVTAGLNIALNLLVIPRFGYAGASCVSAVSTLIILIGVVVRAGSNGFVLKWKRVLIPLAKALLSCCAMIVVLLFLNGRSLIAGALSGVCAYAVCLFALRGVDENDSALFRELLKSD